MPEKQNTGTLNTSREKRQKYSIEEQRRERDKSLMLLLGVGIMKRLYKLILAFLYPGSLVSLFFRCGFTSRGYSFVMKLHNCITQQPLCNVTSPVLGSGLEAGGAEGRVKTSQTCTS